MKIENFEYHFVIRSAKSVSLTLGAIYKDVVYSRFDKNKLANIFKLSPIEVSDRNYIEELEVVALKVEDENREKLTIICSQLDQKWQNYREQYIDIIRYALGIEIDDDAINHLYCNLHMLPINEIDLEDNSIYLDANKNIDDIFKNFIIMLTKVIILNKFKYINRWNFNTEFDAKNKVFMFADIVVDAIFNNTALNKICKRPSYNYFYNLKISDENVMDKFNNLFNQMSVDDFFSEVYMFVYENYQKLLHFKHFLY